MAIGKLEANSSIATRDLFSGNEVGSLNYTITSSSIPTKCIEKTIILIVGYNLNPHITISQ
jgi:hypothetical protein